VGEFSVDNYSFASLKNKSIPIIEPIAIIKPKRYTVIGPILNKGCIWFSPFLIYLLGIAGL